ncbi:MAG: class I SAM-dependent methyltransferase [Planctomycetota bacterium]|jgi:SAM-dependent methyltransferase
MSVRDVPRDEAQQLRAGDEHYMAYVGPPDRYDLMGASQFRLLCTLGLRAHHRLLDFGCGSLRAGRLFIPYLNPGGYFGVEPNRWLVEDAVERELGADIIRIKRPTILDHDTFSCREFGIRFDYILAQSIFSHAGRDLILRGLKEFDACLEPHGITAVTFVIDDSGGREYEGSGWVYPDLTPYTTVTVERLIAEAGLAGIRIPWFHPRQVWYLLAGSAERLPSAADARELTGKVLLTTGDA